jgi:predicted nucleotidyltransferase
MDLSTLRSYREQILSLAQKHGAANVRVFGSVARGTSSANSDVDFLISLGPKRSPFFPGGLIVDLERLLGCPIDIVTEKSLHQLIRDQILAEAKPV